jgi:hypothetical protein
LAAAKIRHAVFVLKPEYRIPSYRSPSPSLLHGFHVVCSGEFERILMLQGEIEENKQLSSDHHPYTFTLWMAGVSNPSPPVVIMPCRVENGEDHDSVVTHDEEDAVRKASGENTADIQALTQAQVEERTKRRTLYGHSNLSHELKSKSSLPIFIPKCGFSDVDLRFVSDDEAMAHALSRVRMRASTSSQELPASGSFS